MFPAACYPRPASRSGALAAPVLSGPGTASGDYTLTWTASSGATSYDLYSSRDDITYSLLVNVAALTYDVTFDFPGMYHYVIAKNGAASSAPSNTLYVALISPGPTSYSYFRPGGIDTYLRFGTSNIYIRP